MNDFEQKVENYRQRKAKNISIAVMLYILSVVVLIGFTCLIPIRGAIIGFLFMLVMIATATGLIIYTSMTVPKDVSDVLSGKISYSKEIELAEGTKKVYGQFDNEIYESIHKLFWLVVTIIYLGVSFLTGAWEITWLIWLIATALEQALKIILSLNPKVKYEIKSKKTENDL